VKIIEAVLFNNELELLEARLHEGDGIVDQWVIIESDKTFTGTWKSLTFGNNRHLFAEFDSRITHHIIYSPLPGTPWQREASQRNALGWYLPDFEDDDLLVLSDADELTRAAAWPEIIEATSNGQSVSLHKPTWYYTLTWALPDTGPDVSSFRSKAARVGDLYSQRTPISEWADDLSYSVVENSGWHLSCLGGPTRLLDKIRNTAHQEINTDAWATYENCKRLIQDGVDCAPQRNAPLTRTDPAGPEWLITEGVTKYPWLLTGEDPCTPPS
jgi:beta-1,4-mannosyl-glycoprotein beta-1,4-N-acetylglucosaminyltransferase